MAPFPSKVGRYEIIRPLGRGAMGAVFLARDPLIARSVAVKMLPPLSEDPVHMQRLLAEARIAGGLDHPNIVRVFDVGEEDGQPFVVMQYVEGRTLAAVLADPARPTLDTKLGWMVQLCDGLAHAHEHRVIHRDLKPSNLMIDARGALRILDFGVAKIVSTSQIKFTSIGTPAYMAPEQYSKAPVDPRTDIFAAGLVLFELVTHTRALEGDSPAEILGQLMRGEIRRLADAAPGVDAGLAAICDRATESDPGARYQTASAMGAALADARHRLSAPTVVEPAVTRLPLAPPSVAQATAATVPVARAPIESTRIDPGPASAAVAVPDDGPPRWRGWVWPALAGTVIVIVAVLGVFWATRPRPAPPAEPPIVVEPGRKPDPVAVEKVDEPPKTDTREAEAPVLPVQPAPVPPAPVPSVLARLRATSDLADVTFWIRPASGSTATRLTPGQTIAPGRYDIRADYIDNDPSMGGPKDTPTTTRRTVNVVAGQTATVDLPLQTMLWRDRFERALVRPAGRGRAAVLEQTYRQLRERSSTTPTDETRYNKAVAEQQVVTIGLGLIAADPDVGAEVSRTRIDLRVDAGEPHWSLLQEKPKLELVTGEHRFVTTVDLAYTHQRYSGVGCVGTFKVAGGPATELKVDFLLHRDSNPGSYTKPRIDCQLGGASPLRSQMPPPKPSRLTVQVQDIMSNVPVPGATAVLMSSNRTIVARAVGDSQGTARFTDVLPGEYVLRVDRAGFLGATRRTTLLPADNANATVDVTAAASQMQSDAEGRFSMSLPPGKYDVVVELTGYSPLAFIGLDVSRSRGVEIQVVLRDHAEGPRPTKPASGQTIAGTVTDASGRPLPDAMVTAVALRRR